MRILVLTLFLGIVGSAEAGLFAKKKATDAEGNCVPELVAENARLYGELEVLDQIATRSEEQIKSPLKESKKLGMASVKELQTKAKATLAAIKKYGDTFENKACKAQVVKAGKSEMITFQVSERVASLEKLAATYEKIADDFLKKNIAFK